MKKLIALSLVLMMAFSVIPMALAAGVSVTEGAVIDAGKPTIDGAIEAAWGKLDAVMDYDETTQTQEDKIDKAEFWYMYDAQNLYIACKATFIGKFIPERSRVQVRLDTDANNSVWDGVDSLGILTFDAEGKVKNAAGDSAIAKGTLAGKLDGTVAVFEMSVPISALGSSISVKADSKLRVGVTVWDSNDKQYGATLATLNLAAAGAAAPAAPAEDEKVVIEMLKPRGTINYDGKVTVEEWGVPSITAENETTKVDFYFRHDDKGVYMACVAKSEVMAAGGYQAGLVYRYQKDGAAAPAYIGCTIIRGDNTTNNNFSTGKIVRNGGDITLEVFQPWEALGVTKGKDIYGQFQWLDYSEQTKSVVLNPNGTDKLADFITFRPVDKVAPDKVEEKPAAPATPATPSTPATFDAGIIAAVVALTAGAGVVVSKKRR